MGDLDRGPGGLPSPIYGFRIRGPRLLAVAWAIFPAGRDRPAPQQRGRRVFHLRPGFIPFTTCREGVLCQADAGRHGARLLAQGWLGPLGGVVLVGAMVAISNLYLQSSGATATSCAWREASKRWRASRNVSASVATRTTCWPHARVIVLKSELASARGPGMTRAVAEIRDVERSRAIVERGPSRKAIDPKACTPSSNAERVLVAAGVKPLVDRPLPCRPTRSACWHSPCAHQRGAPLGCPALLITLRTEDGRAVLEVKDDGHSAPRAGGQRAVGDARAPAAGRRHARAEVGADGTRLDVAAPVPGPEAPRHDSVLIAEDQAMVLGAPAALIDAADLEVVAQARPGTRRARPLA